MGLTICLGICNPGSEFLARFTWGGTSKIALFGSNLDGGFDATFGFLEDWYEIPMNLFLVIYAMRRCRLEHFQKCHRFSHARKRGQVPIVRSTLRAIWLLVPDPFSDQAPTSFTKMLEPNCRIAATHMGVSLARSPLRRRKRNDAMLLLSITVR